MKKLKKSNIKYIIRTKGEVEVLITGCKENINSPWVDRTFHKFTTIEGFEKFIEEFTFYRCNSQTGYYPVYYIIEK